MRSVTLGHADEDCIFITHEAANPGFHQVKDGQRIDAVRRKYDLPANFILAIGSADPRKNISRLVQAYSLFSKELREKYQLVIVWTHSLLAHELSEQVEQLQLGSSIRFLRSVPNDDLYEGFGLPLLEAMACGVPVVAADNSSIPDIVGDAALLIDMQDVVGMSNIIRRILTDDSLKTMLINNGIERAASFSWKKCGRETIAIYDSIFSGR